MNMFVTEEYMLCKSLTSTAHIPMQSRHATMSSSQAITVKCTQHVSLLGSHVLSGKCLAAALMVWVWGRVLGHTLHVCNESLCAGSHHGGAASVCSEGAPDGPGLPEGPHEGPQGSQVGSCLPIGCHGPHSSQLPGCLHLPHGVCCCQKVDFPSCCAIQALLKQSLSQAPGCCNSVLHPVPCLHQLKVFLLLCCDAHKAQKHI